MPCHDSLIRRHTLIFISLAIALLCRGRGRGVTGCGPSARKTCLADLINISDNRIVERQQSATRALRKILRAVSNLTLPCLHTPLTQGGLLHQLAIILSRLILYIYSRNTQHSTGNTKQYCYSKCQSLATSRRASLASHASTVN